MRRRRCGALPAGTVAAMRRWFSRLGEQSHVYRFDGLSLAADSLSAIHAPHAWGARGTSGRRPPARAAARHAGSWNSPFPRTVLGTDSFSAKLSPVVNPHARRRQEDSGGLGSRAIANGAKPARQFPRLGVLRPVSWLIASAAYYASDWLISNGRRNGPGAPAAIWDWVRCGA